MQNELTFEQLRKDTLERSTRHTDREKWNELYYKKPPTILDHVELDSNKIIAGMKTLNYNGNKNEIVVTDVEKFGKDGKPLTIHALTVGENGTGKTVFSAHLIYNNFSDRFHEPIFIYDPKDEWSEHDEPSFTSKADTKKRKLVDKLLDEIGEVEGKKLQRKGYPSYKIIPFCGKNTSRKGVHKFAISYDNILRLRKKIKAEAPKQLIRLLGLDQQPHELLYALIESTLEDEDVKSFKEFMESVKKKQRKKDERGLEIINPNKPDEFSEKTTVPLLRKMTMALQNKYITDIESESINVLELIRDCNLKHEGHSEKDYNVVIFIGQLKSSHSLSPAEIPFYVTLDITFKLIFDDCMAFHVEGDYSSIIQAKNGILIVIDELTMVANANEKTETRDMVANFVLQGRAGKMDFLGIAQASSQIYNELFEQIKIIFTTPLTPSNTKMLAEKGVEKHWIDKKEGGMLTSLKKAVEPIICGEKSGMRVSQIAIIDSNTQRVQKCYPFPPLSNSL